MLWDRYLLVEWSKAFAMALFATLGILLVEDIQDDLSDFLNWGASTADILKYYLFLLPSFLPVVLPVALLVSVLFALGNLHRRNEIVALRAAGMHLFSISRALLAVGVLMAGLMLYLNASLVPQSIEQTRTLRQNLRFASEARLHSDRDVGVIRALTYDNWRDRRRWVINRFSEYTLQGYGVSVYVMNEYGNEVSRVYAGRAVYDDVDRYWVLHDGREMTFDPATGDAIRQDIFEERAYMRFTETPEMMKQSSKPPRELSYREIGAVLRRSPPEHNPQMLAHAVRHASILASPVICLLVMAIGIPFSVAGVRANAMVNVIKAAGLFLAYAVLASICEHLGTIGLLQPLVAAWLPSVLMLAPALWLWRRVL